MCETVSGCELAQYAQVCTHLFEHSRLALFSSRVTRSAIWHTLGMHSDIWRVYVTVPAVITALHAQPQTIQLD